MNSYQIDNTVYATNNDLTGFFSRRESSGAYNQQIGNGQIFFANEKEFQKYCRARHNNDDYSKTADVTSGGKFVWRVEKY